MQKSIVEACLIMHQSLVSMPHPQTHSTENGREGGIKVLGNDFLIDPCRGNAGAVIFLRSGMITVALGNRGQTVEQMRVFDDNFCYFSIKTCVVGTY